MRPYDCCFGYHTDYFADESRAVGSAVAIILADEMNSDVLLMGEHKGRQVAKKLGITITGTIGILTQAYDEGMLMKEGVERCIERLKESGIRISEKLYQRLIKKTGK